MMPVYSAGSWISLFSIQATTLDVWEDEAATYIRRFLRHAAFRIRTQRMGKVVRVHHNGVSYWQVDVKKMHALSW